SRRPTTIRRRRRRARGRWLACPSHSQGAGRRRGRRQEGREEGLSCLLSHWGTDCLALGGMALERDGCFADRSATWRPLESTFIGLGWCTLGICPPLPR